MHELLVEMLIISIIGIFSVSICTLILIKHWHEKDWEKIRAPFLAGIIFMLGFILIVEAIWLAMCIGMPI